MKGGLKEIEITNFKSIRSLVLSDCRRINVLIGRPNVGKSNILEALALFDVPYFAHSSFKSLKSLLRINNTSELFHNGDSSSPIAINTGKDKLRAARTLYDGLTIDMLYNGRANKFSLPRTLTLPASTKPIIFLPDILVYFFPVHFSPSSSNHSFLIPPYGSNLMEIVANTPALKEELSELFHTYGLKLLFDTGSKEIRAMKEDGFDMFLVPFGSLADSLRRLIFYKCAIESNRNKVICIEEPEAHTFPPYITNIVNDLLESVTNQFFLTTHSPYVLSALLESAGDELAVYVVDMKNSATVARRLSDKELQEAYDNGMDMFYNIEAYSAE
ncbi:MAG: AAA family ATPase [Muribaculaceae bacterium]|nr:AAA family ATPase [Muribaculaceae bacterium]